jgi:hypothetical protein
LTIAEIRAYLSEHASTPEVIALLGELSPLTSDKVKGFLEGTEDGKKLANSLTDQRVSQGIETFKKNNLSALVNAEYIKLHPDETPADKKLRELEQKFEASQKNVTIMGLKNKALKVLDGKKINKDLLDLLEIGDTEEAVNTNVAKFVLLFDTAVNEAVAIKFKENGRDAPNGDDFSKNFKGKNPFSKEHFNMTEQGKLIKENPELAEQLRAAAGKK